MPGLLQVRLDASWLIFFSSVCQSSSSLQHQSRCRFCQRTITHTVLPGYRKLAVSAQKENTFKQEESQEGFIFFCFHVKEEKKLVKTSRCGKKTVQKMTDCSLAKVSHSQMLLCEMWSRCFRQPSRPFWTSAAEHMSDLNASPQIKLSIFHTVCAAGNVPDKKPFWPENTFFLKLLFERERRMSALGLFSTLLRRGLVYTTDEEWSEQK